MTVEAKLAALERLDEERAAHIEYGWPNVLKAIRDGVADDEIIQVTANQFRPLSKLRELLEADIDVEIDAALDEQATDG